MSYMSIINILGIQRFQKLLSGGGGPQDKCQKMCRMCKGKRDEEATHGERHKRALEYAAACPETPALQGGPGHEQRRLVLRQQLSPLESFHPGWFTLWALKRKEEESLSHYIDAGSLGYLSRPNSNLTSCHKAFSSQPKSLIFFSSEPS